MSPGCVQTQGSLKEQLGSVCPNSLVSCGQDPWKGNLWDGDSSSPDTLNTHPAQTGGSAKHTLQPPLAEARLLCAGLFVPWLVLTLQSEKGDPELLVWLPAGASVTTEWNHGFLHSELNILQAGSGVPLQVGTATGVDLC